MKDHPLKKLAVSKIIMIMINVTVILIVIGAFGVIPKGLVRLGAKGIRNMRIRKGGGRGLTSIEDSVDTSIQRLKEYIEKHEWGLITAIRNDTDNALDNRMKITRKQKWEGKQLYGLFKRLINNISHDKTWTWLRKGNFKRETESLLMVVQTAP